MTKRLFLAIKLSAEDLGKLVNYGDNFSVKNIRFTEMDNLHLTVHFLGDTKEEVIPEIIKRFKEEFSKIESFTLKFNQIIWGPPGRNPRMIWATYFGHDNYQKLAVTAYRLTKDLLFEIEQPKFLPHITLARFREGINIKEIELKQIPLRDLGVEKCYLFESDLQPNGPVYTSLAEFCFEGVIH